MGLKEGTTANIRGRYKTRLSEIDRFWALVQKTTTCWLWRGSMLPKGYGLFRITSPRSKVLAHRYSYTLKHGCIPPGLMVLHKCDNTSCVRPGHLFVGTNQDNVDDMVRKNRHQHGDKHYKRRRKKCV